MKVLVHNHITLFGKCQTKLFLSNLIYFWSLLIAVEDEIFISTGIYIYYEGGPKNAFKVC